MKARNSGQAKVAAGRDGLVFNGATVAAAA
jgi:hypothetical protein